MTEEWSEFTEAAKAIADERYAEKVARGFAHLAFQVSFPTFAFTDDQAEEITSVDRSGDLGIDGVYVAEQEQQILLFQSKSSAGLSEPEISDRVAAFLSNARKLQSDEWVGRANAEMRSLANEYRVAVAREYEVVYAFATASPIGEGVRAMFHGVSEVPETGIPASLEMLDADALESRYRKLLLGEHGRFTDVEFAVTEEQIHKPTSELAVVYLTIPAHKYVAACKRYGMELFRYNPRLFLGSNKVNSGIASTLKSDSERTYFHLLNNGITAVCRTLDVDDLPAGEKLVRAEDFQVVNGCQTTLTLFLNSADVERNDRCMVDIKIIESPGLRERISITTNTQTAILAEDAFANEVEQRRVYDLFRRYSPPFFYAPKRGSWEQLKPTEKRKYVDERVTFGRYRRLSSKELAAVCLAIFDEPEAAKDRPRIVFEKADGKNSLLYERIFQVGNVAAQWLLPWEVFRHANVLVKQESLHNPESERARVGVYGRYRMLQLAYGYLASISGEPRGPKSMEFLSRAKSERFLRTANKWAPNLLPITLDALVDAFGDAKAREKTTGLREFFREDKHQPLVQERFEKALLQHRRLAERVGTMEEYLGFA